MGGRPRMTGAIETVGIVGAGVMGRGVAQTAAVAGLDVVVMDIAADAIAQAARGAADSLARAAQKGRISEADAEAARGRIAWTSDAACLADRALLIETAPERLELKRAILADLEARARPDALLATNTSSLSIAAIAQTLTRPERLAGLHFFNPAPVMRLVEVVRTPLTPEATLNALCAFAERLGKRPVRCADTPGFVVNRCARPFYGEALALLEEGRRDADAIDAACRAAGYKLGPFALIDLVGADVNLAATQSVAAAFDGHPRYHVFGALRRQVAAGRLGRKTGGGFVSDPSAAPPADADEIVGRIEAALVNEACFLADQSGVAETEIDAAVTLGLNFPRGPFAIADAAGRSEIVRRLERLEATAPPDLRGRYAPAAHLTRTAEAAA